MEPARSLLEPHKVAVTAPIGASPLLVSAAQIQIDSVFCLWVLSGHWRPLFAGRPKVLGNLHSQYLFLSATARNVANPYRTLVLLPFPAGRGHLGSPEFRLPVMATRSPLFLCHICTPFLIFPGTPPPNLCWSRVSEPAFEGTQPNRG